MQPIIFYFPTEDLRATELQNVVQTVVQNVSFTVLRDLHSLEYSLHHSLTTPSVVFLSLPSREDLLQILMLKEELMLSSLVLVLPDQAPDMIALAHRLRPRFVAYIDDDFTLIAEVLSRLIQDLDLPHKELVTPRPEDACSATG